MIPDHLLPHTVIRIRPTETTDSHGNTVYDYDPGTRVSWQAWMQQSSGTEPLSDGRDPLEFSWLLVANEPDIAGRDRVQWNELVFEVDGPPKPVYTPAGYHHTETKLKAVHG